MNMRSIPFHLEQNLAKGPYVANLSVMTAKFFCFLFHLSYHHPPVTPRKEQAGQRKQW